MGNYNFPLLSLLSRLSKASDSCYAGGGGYSLSFRVSVRLGGAGAGFSGCCGSTKVFGVNGVDGKGKGGAVVRRGSIYAPTKVSTGVSFSFFFPLWGTLGATSVVSPGTSGLPHTSHHPTPPTPPGSL